MKSSKKKLQKIGKPTTKSHVKEKNAIKEAPFGKKHWWSKRTNLIDKDFDLDNFIGFQFTLDKRYFAIQRKEKIFLVSFRCGFQHEKKNLWHVVNKCKKNVGEKSGKNIGPGMLHEILALPISNSHTIQSVWHTQNKILEHIRLCSWVGFRNPREVNIWVEKGAGALLEPLEKPFMLAWIALASYVPFVIFRCTHLSQKKTPKTNQRSETKKGLNKLILLN